MFDCVAGGFNLIAQIVSTCWFVYKHRLSMIKYRVDADFMVSKSAMDMDQYLQISPILTVIKINVVFVFIK